MTSILISRFVINLRGVYTPGGSTAGSIHLSRFSDARFANGIVGNLGAPLGFGEEEDNNISSTPEGENAQVTCISDNPLMEYFPSSLNNAQNGPAEGEGVSG